MTDIVERLRACHGIISGDPECCCEEAAAEIERLRAALTEIACIEYQDWGPDWEEIEEACRIANAALGTERLVAALEPKP